MKTLKDVMIPREEVLGPHLTLRLAAEVLRRLGVRALPVCEGGTPVGVVSDRDLVVRGLALGRDPDSARISSVMTRGVERLSQDTRVDEAAGFMRARRLPQVLIVDADEHLVGLVSLSDLLPGGEAPAPLPPQRAGGHPTPEGRPSIIA